MVRVKLRFLDSDKGASLSHKVHNPNLTDGIKEVTVRATAFCFRKQQVQVVEDFRDDLEKVSERTSNVR